MQRFYILQEHFIADVFDINGNENITWFITKTELSPDFIDKFIL